MSSRRIAQGYWLTFCLLASLLAQAQDSSNVDAVRQNLQAVQSTDRAVAQKALAALNRVGPEARELLPDLVEGIESENRLVREVAKQLLRRVDPQRAKSLLGDPFDPVQSGRDEIRNLKVGKNDWPQLGGSGSRNNTPAGKNIPTTWAAGEIDRRTGDWIRSKATMNIKWLSKLGSQSYGNIVVANGKIYVGTNNTAGYLKRFPTTVDLGCLLCFRESDGEFLWQHSSEKLPTGRVNDWPLQGICSSPILQGDRLWFVTSRGEVVCLDTDGFDDNEDDGPVTDLWSRLFEVVANLNKLADAFAKQRLPEEYNNTLAPIFQQTELNALYSQSIEPAGKPNQWFFTTGGRTPTRLSHITLDNSKLQITGVGENSGKHLEIGLDLLAALDEGRMSFALQAQLKAKGVEISDETKPTVLLFGKSWAVSATSEEKPVELRLDLEDRKLICYQRISSVLKNEADVVWSFDMMKELGVRQHNMATCAPTMWGDVLFICTSNGVDETHIKIPAPDAPSFMAMDKRTGKVLWTDNSPGENILHGQWSCPVVGVFDGVPQVIFAGGDGWLYSFRADRWENDKPEFLWKFDGNPKESKYSVDARSTRNQIIAVPVIYDGLVYLAMGEDPEHGEGEGHLWCVDPTKRGDVSAELAVDASGNKLPLRRFQAAIPWDIVFQMQKKAWDGLDDGKMSETLRAEFHTSGYPLPERFSINTKKAGQDWLLEAEIGGQNQRFSIQAHSFTRRGENYYSLTVRRQTNETVIANPNSAAVWHYDKFDANNNGRIEFEETMHRSIGSPAIKNDLLFITDFSGLCHCLNAKTGIPYWTCDLLAACWTTPLIVEDKVYVGDEDGDVAIFGLSADPTGFVKPNPDHVGPAHEINMGNSIYMMPIVANNVLYIAARTHLYAIEAKSQ